MNNVIIRNATLFDHSEILKLSIQWFDELIIEGFPGINSNTGIWLADLIANHIFLVGEINKKIIGCLGLRVGCMPWNNEDNVLFNEVFMTDKNYRGTGVAGKLLDSIKQFVENNNLMLIMGHMTGMDAELKDRYLSMKGFKYAGANFIHGRA